MLATTEDWADDEAAWALSLSRMQTRGPDAGGTCLLDGVRLGHRRLSIIGLGGLGAQPMLSSNGRQALVFNGEIYNYKDLAQTLGVPAVSDTRVLLELLTRDIGLLSRVVGMYAFVFWDATSRTLVACRDPAGIKPLYFVTHASGGVSLASVVASLGGLDGAGGEDVESILGWLASGFFPAGTTPFHGISKMEPGVVHVWTRHHDGWQLKQMPVDTPSAPVHMDLRSGLEESVKNHLIADVPVGVLMSGGVDSTLLAAISARYTSPLHTYTLTNPKHPSIDESDFARRNARALGSSHTEVVATPSELARQAAPLIASAGEPFCDAAYLPLALLCERVSRDVKVVLAGEGADEVFGGYRRYDVEEFLSRSHGIRVPNRATATLTPLKSLSSRLPSRISRTMRASLAEPGYERHALLMGRNWQIFLAAFPNVGPSLLSRYETLWNDQSTLWNQSMPDYQRFDLRQWLPNVYLEKSDRSSMLHSVEVRVPFLNPSLSSIANRLQIRDTRKRELRAILRDFLPDVALPRRKMGLSVSLLDILGTEQFRDHLNSELSDTSGIASYIDGKPRRAQFVDHVKGSPGAQFQLANLNMWRELRKSAAP